MKMTDHIVDSEATSELSRRKVLMLLGGSLLSLAIVPRRSVAASTGFTASAGGSAPRNRAVWRSLDPGDRNKAT